MGFAIIGTYGDREPQQNDTQVFKHLIHKAYKSVNWYSFKPQDQKNDGCCTHQTAMYIQNGQRRGLSPEEYYNKIFGFQIIDAKKLVLIKARWNRQLCANIVTQLGFGKGELKVVAKRGLNSNFAFPPIAGNYDVPVFIGATIQTRLSFTWFLVHVVCVEKPDLCPPFMKKPHNMFQWEESKLEEKTVP
ncbi:uncharacterized protein LOC142338198 [Convolutriloba macropyga]|uniref:uncharacterized protein LOC142338198 n=1 Tax=Convolutriloba macropyga TaxID=536237 RepID=UPI003F5208CA